VICRKRKKVPLYDQTKKAEIRRTLGRLFRQHLSNDLPFVVMDDETYITQNDEAKFGSRFYYAKNPANTAEDIRTIGITKFPFKIGLWFAVSDKGISDYFIWRQGLAIDGYKYKVYCLQQRLLPYIRQHFPDGNYIFWPDKASAHYAKNVLQYLSSKHIRLVPKVNNPTNVPQCRPIETLHAQIKQRVFADKFHPKSVADLEFRIREIMDNLKCHAPSMCNGFSAKVRALVNGAYRNGLLSVHK
jgi:hypothetical protein